MEFKKEVLGQFFPGSTLIKLNYSYQEIRKKWMTLETLSKIKKPDNPFEGFKIPSYDKDSIFSQLTLAHELDHYKLSQSTPFGLLLWRIYQCLMVDYSYLNHELSKVEAFDKMQFPYSKWIEENFNELIKEYKGNRDYLVLVQDEITTLSRFLFALLGRPKITVGDFIEIANKAFLYLGKRCDLKNNCKWSTKLPLDNELYSSEHFSCIELIEASARHRELTVLESFNLYDLVFFKEWELVSLHGVYKKGTTNLLKKLGSPSNAKTAIDIAFNGPIDIACFEVNEEIYLEDILPVYRIDKITRAMRNTFIQENDKLFHKQMLEDLADNANVPSPKKALSRLIKSNLWGDTFWGGNPDKSLYGNQTFREVYGDLTSLITTELYYEHIRNVFKENFKKRLEKSYFFLGTWKENYQAPLLTFYNDFVDFEITTITKDDDFKHQIIILQAYNIYLSHTITGYLAGGGDIKHLRQTDRVLEETLNKLKLDYLIDFFNNYHSLNAVIKNQFGSISKQLMELFN